MKIIQINTIYGSKSTGRTCAELEKYMVKCGHECVTAYGHGKKYGGNTYRICTDIEYYIHNILSRLTGLEGYFSLFATLRLVRFIKKFNPDIVHLRNLHGHYINLPYLFRFLNKTQLPVVVHLHDCWILSGGCTHPTNYNCYGWLTDCKNCPAKHEYPESKFFDFSGKMLKDKKKWFGKLKNVRVIGVSNWVADEGEKSYLKSFPVTSIYNWINTDVFYPREEVNIGKFGLDSSKFNIICVGASWDGNEGKYKDLLSLSEKIDKDMHIVVVGKADNCEKRDNITYIGFTDSTDELAELYSLCDAYVHLSTADTFGKVIAEAMACGIPAVVYNVTACPELVSEGCGSAVEPHDVGGIVEKLCEIKNCGKSFYSQKCVERVNNNFLYKSNVEKTIALYKDMII